MRIRNIALISLLVLVGCTAANLEAEKIEVYNPLKPERTTDFQEFNATLEDTYTKTTLDAKTMKVAWEYTDEVLITDGKHRAIYSPKKQEGQPLTSTAVLCRVSGDTLTARWEDPEVVYKAYYPKELADEGLKGVQTFGDPDIYAPVPMVAEGHGDLEFKNICSVLRFEYKPSKNIIVKSIDITADQPLSGKGDIDFANATITLTGEPALNGVRYDYAVTGVTYYANKIKSFNVFIPEGIYTKLKADINYYLSTDTTSVKESVTLLYKMKAARCAQTVIDLNNPEGKEVNLAKYGTANCYPISAGEEFYFKPTKGCSDDAVGQIDSVGVIWAMDNTDIEPAEDWFIRDLRYDSEENVIRFSIPADGYHPGNVLVGAFDSEGKVLWSWHIWILKSSIQDLIYDSANQILVQDRYIGMLNSQDGYGSSSSYLSRILGPGITGSLLFQWGRKDPFPGAATYISSRPRIKVRGTETSIVKGPVAISESILNPCNFYCKDGGNWCSESHTWDQTKTIYDPCPAGYRVLSRSTMEAEPIATYITNLGLVTLSGATQAYRSKTNTESIQYIFPLCGYLKASNGDMYPSNAGGTYFWTLENSGSNATGYYVKGSAKALQTDSYPMASGLAVRCEKIKVLDE